MRKGFTLIETIIVTMLLAVMVAVMVTVFSVILTAWSSQEKRTGVDISVEDVIKRAVIVDNDLSVSPALRMSLREAVAVSDHSGRDEIRFAVKQRDGVDQPSLNAQGNPIFSYYIYYLYNSADGSYPPAFNQSSYQLKRAALSGATVSTLDAGTFTYGSGNTIVDSVLPPTYVSSPSDLSVSNNVVTLDLSIMRGSERTRSRTRVKPRNIGNL
jgi:prepilin-type N-terminal cleavage/methylation domain-containing protein